MKTKILSITFIAIFVLSASVMAQPENRRERNPEQKERMMKHRQGMKDRFENFFTEEQKEKMKELRLETAKKVKPLKNELRELQARQQTLTTADKADLNAINKNIDKMAGLKADIQKIMAKQHQEIRSMLSEEQLIKFDAMKGRFNKKRGDFAKRRMHRSKRAS
jgi:Spy/CpxP family protein refolding chaperone